MSRVNVDILETFFADHLSESPGAEHATEVTRVGVSHPRLVLFKVGQIRFALASTAIAAYTRVPEIGCTYVDGTALVPARYRAAARVDDSHGHFIHLTGTRLGIGPCKADGETVAGDGDLTPRSRQDDEPWIVATLGQPPSLVLDKQALCTRLHAVASA
jgi:hypothetical protein